MGVAVDQVAAQIGKAQLARTGSGALVIGGLPRPAPRPQPAMGSDPEGITQATDDVDGGAEFAADGDQAVFAVEVAVSKVGGQVGKSQRLCASFKRSPVRGHRCERGLDD